MKLQWYEKSENTSPIHPLSHPLLTDYVPLFQGYTTDLQAMQKVAKLRHDHMTKSCVDLSYIVGVWVCYAVKTVAT